MYSDRVLESDEAKPPIDGMYGQYLLLGTPTLDFQGLSIKCSILSYAY